jgi:hypothetical protein
MVKKKAYLSLEGEEGEGYLPYPSPDFGLGLTQSFQRYLIDTTDSCFDQGAFSIREDVPLATSGAMSTMRALQAMGAWICCCLF